MKPTAAAHHPRFASAFAPDASGPSAAATASTSARWADPLLVAVAAAAAFSPSLFGDFLNWDDDVVFVDQLFWRGLGRSQLEWMFTTFHMGHYRPVAWLSHGLEHMLWGLRPAGYHLGNILLHAGAAVTFLFVARRLFRAALDAAASELAIRMGAIGAALLFAVHPLRVEPVSWLSTRADVLSGLFALLTVLAYLRACESSTSRPAARRWYRGSVALFALALASKPVAVTLPLVLVVLDVYPLRRVAPSPRAWLGRTARRVWLEKIPFAALAAVSGAVAVWARLEFGSLLDLGDFPVVTRVTALAYGLAFYLGKTVFPLGLSPLYDYRSVLANGAWLLLVGTGVAAGLTLLAILRRRAWPGLAAAWASYVVILLPVSGLVQNGPQIAADRYTYLAGLGWALLAGAGIAWCAEQWWRRGPSAPWGAGALIAAAMAVVALVGLTARQSLVWQDSVTLWRHAVRLDPHSPIAHVNLASALWRQDPDQALAHYSRAAQLAPGFAPAHLGIAFVLSLKGRDAEALAAARVVTRVRPEASQSWLFLGEALRVNGRMDEAVRSFVEAARLDPGAPQPRFRLAATLAEVGHREQAKAELERGEALALAAGRPEHERHRAAALVYEPMDPVMAEAAWRRYVAAVGTLPRLGPADRQQMLNALTSLDRLSRPEPPATTRAPGR